MGKFPPCESLERGELTLVIGQHQAPRQVVAIFSILEYLHIPRLALPSRLQSRDGSQITCIARMGDPDTDCRPQEPITDWAVRNHRVTRM